MLLLATLCLVGLSFAEPDENGFEYTTTEGGLSISTSVPGGTSDINPGDSRQIDFEVTRQTWEVWTHPGTSEVIHKNHSSEPASFAYWSAMIVSGDGWGGGSGSLDGSGMGSTSYTMSTDSPPQGANFEIQVSDYSGATASATLWLSPSIPPEPGDPPAEETWSYSHSEGTLRASLSSSSGTTGVPVGVEMPVQLMVEYDSWDVETSNYGNSRTANHTTSAASGATLSWSVAGDGSLSADVEADWSGYANATFTMGGSDTAIEVQISYAGGSSASASLPITVQLPSYPMFSGTRTAYQFAESTTLFENLQPGTEYAFSGQLMQREEEVWQQEGGGESIGSATAWVPAPSQSISLYVVGDGGLSATSLTTDGSGNFSGTLTLGAETSTVVVSPVAAPLLESVYYFVPALVPPPVEPYLLRYEWSTTVDLNSGSEWTAEPGSTGNLNGTVTSSSWEVWTDDHTEWDDNGTSGPGMSTIYLTVAQGAAMLSATEVNSDENGQFTVEVTMPSNGASSIIEARLSPGSSVPDATVTVTSAVEETWTDDGDPFWQQSVSMWASDYEGNPGQTATIYTQVTNQQMIQQVSNLGNTQTVVWGGNPDPTPGEGVSVSYTLPNGSGGTLSTHGPTDNDGIATATYTFGTTDGAVEVVCQGQSSVLSFAATGVVWEGHSATRARVEWEQVPEAGVLAPGASAQLKVQVISEEITWSENNYGEDTERVVVSSSPVEGAQVEWSKLTPGSLAGTITTDGPGGTSITDDDGIAYATFTMGTTAESKIKALATPYGSEASGETTITRNTLWTDQGTFRELVVTIIPLEAPPRTLQARVEEHTGHRFSHAGQTHVFNFQSSPLGGVPVEWSVVSGTGQIQTPTGSTSTTNSTSQGTHGTHNTRVAALNGAVINAAATFDNLIAQADLVMDFADMGSLDQDGDSVPDTDEIGYETDPFDPQSTPPFVLAAVSGQGQLASEGQPAPDPLVVSIKRAGKPVVGISIAVAVSYGKVSPALTGSWTSSLATVSDIQGRVQAYWQASSTVQGDDDVSFSLPSGEEAFFHPHAFNDGEDDPDPPPGVFRSGEVKIKFTSAHGEVTSEPEQGDEFIEVEARNSRKTIQATFPIIDPPPPEGQRFGNIVSFFDDKVPTLLRSDAPQWMTAGGDSRAFLQEQFYDFIGGNNGFLPTLTMHQLQFYAADPVSHERSFYFRMMGPTRPEDRSNLRFMPRGTFRVNIPKESTSFFLRVDSSITSNLVKRTGNSVVLGPNPLSIKSDGPYNEEWFVVPDLERRKSLGTEKTMIFASVYKAAIEDRRDEFPDVFKWRYRAENEGEDSGISGDGTISYQQAQDVGFSYTNPRTNWDLFQPSGYTSQVYAGSCTAMHDGSWTAAWTAMRFICESHDDSVPNNALPPPDTFYLIFRETTSTDATGQEGETVTSIAGSVNVEFKFGNSIADLTLDRASGTSSQGVSKSGDWLHLVPTSNPGCRDTFRLVPMEVNCPELYTFSGHTGDTIQLCKTPGTCEWRLKNASPAIGTFDQPTNLACSFTPTTPGKNTIQLVIDGRIAWEKSIEVLGITSRTVWGAHHPQVSQMSTMPSIEGLTYHHSADTGDGAAEVLRIQEFHMSKGLFSLVGNGWADIGYHFVMDKAGNVYEGRMLESAPGAAQGPYTLGAQVKGTAQNMAAGIGICMLGNYEVTSLGATVADAFPVERQTSLEKALTAISRRYNLNATQLSYHKARAVSNPTACPGSQIIGKADEIKENVKRNLK